MDEKRAIKILTDLLAIDSANDHESLVADYIAALFANYPVQIERITYKPGRDNLVVTLGNKGPLLGFSGHEDVVDAGNQINWQFPPFTPTLYDGKIYGRGASDMKSGLAAMIVSMLDLLESGKKLPGRIRLLASVGEETGEYGAAQLTKKGYVQDLDGLIIGEPSNFNIRVTHKGIIDYYVSSSGKCVHSSIPQEGKNAIMPLIQFAQQAQSLMDSHQEKDPILGSLTHVISQIQGGNQINSVPDQAWLSGNIRTTPKYPNDQICGELEQIIAKLNSQGAKLSIRYSYPEVPLPDQSNSQLARLAQEVVQQEFGKDCEFTAGTGATDASEYIQAGNFPVIILGPAEGKTDHQPNEFIKIKDYLLGCKLYQVLAWRFWQEYI
ncbi:succinyl-diaminopimelate desuccinylase [Lactobacillus bombicola]|uniref:Probable succinyl-diaminopimelate desuccinylase n=1 Tax=Lactobacillus bombicola TaxID=1505723 RepID=A0A1I1RXI2_9LACO|nr:ArgE/DapE family deacylase [Lactobacillus bombicola]SFD36988.1 succinyl-diaminopimelate desuccinylase [Lactobacillus bombicola]